jgi:hypothetical protein
MIVTCPGNFAPTNGGISNFGAILIPAKLAASELEPEFKTKCVFGNEDAF